MACPTLSLASRRRPRGRLFELAVDDGEDENDKDSDDGNGDYAIRSHPATGWSVRREEEEEEEEGEGTGPRGEQYLRAIPRSVLTLRST